MSRPLQLSGCAAATRLLALALTASLLGACSWLIGIEDLPQQCESNADCAYLGPGATCNASHTCVPPSGADCDSSAECTLENEPICDTTCRPCETDDECKAKDATKPICRGDGVCIDETAPECVDSAGCTNTPETPICDTSMGKCVRCDEAADQDACSEVGGGNMLYCATTGDNAGSCVQCLNADHCNSDKPVCDQGANMCVGCTEHSQCAAYSGACGGEACASEDDVIYVVKDAPDTTTCSRAMPCGKLNDALNLVTATRRFIVIDDEIPEIYAEHLALAPPTGNVTIIGNGASILGTQNKAVIDVTGGADVTFVGLTVDHANTSSLAEGIHCQNSTISIETSIVRGAAAIGISVNGCSLTIERSMITANDGGGIDITQSSFSIVNSFITGNGKDTGATTSNLGGVRIANLDQKEPQFFAFNTVAENRAGAGAPASGVQCSVNAISTVTATSSIIRKGYGGRPTLAGDCVWRNSNVEDGESVSSLAPTGMGNSYMDCSLADDGNGIFRIDAGTPCDNAGQPDTGVLDDYEGKSRSPTAPDMGADELDDAPAPAARTE